jgi:hypothetical protein
MAIRRELHDDLLKLPADERQTLADELYESLSDEPLDPPAVIGPSDLEPLRPDVLGLDNSRHRGNVASRMAKTAKKKPSTKKALDWRVATLSRIRTVITDAVPDVIEARKWIKPSSPGGVAVWSRDGIICTGEVYKDKVKMTFARGASLADPSGLFNASLDGGTRRAIDVHEGDELDEEAFAKLVRAAAALNATKKK